MSRLSRKCKGVLAALWVAHAIDAYGRAKRYSAHILWGDEDVLLSV